MKKRLLLLLARQDGAEHAEQHAPQPRLPVIPSTIQTASAPTTNKAPVTTTKRTSQVGMVTLLGAARLARLPSNSRDVTDGIAFFVLPRRF